VHRLQEAHILYLGLDIHEKRIAICVLGDIGQIVRRARVRTIDEMVRVLEALTDWLEVCYEASRGYGYYHDLLNPIASPSTTARSSDRRGFRGSVAKPGGVAALRLQFVCDDPGSSPAAH
jgi:hypothetical protein